ncbi:MAG: acyl-CoA dehydrogenase [Rhodobacteraceae bacterium]|nr:acyl-CoA dehydrogenase [Paracoccaceae bacterium]
MDFDLSDEQTAIFDMAKRFGAEYIAPFAQDWDEAGTIPKELWPKAAALGLGGLFVGESAGGAGLTRLDGTLVFEALSMACPSVAAFLSIHNMCAAMIDSHGASALKSQVLADTIAMRRFTSYCLTEPGAGSDAAALRTRAMQNGENYALSGTKAFISGGGYSDAYVVMARTGGDGPSGISAFLVDGDAEGLSFGAPERKMGWKNQPTRQIQFDDCRVPATRLIGEAGRGFVYAMQGLDGGRLNIAACSLGAAQSAFDATRTYMAERTAFGKSIDSYQALQFRLADMEIGLTASRTLLRQAAWKLDRSDADAARHCAMAKAFVTETASRIADDCLQLHGGYGYLQDYGIEKIVRDLRVHRILEGTNEIMRVVIARDLVS